MKPFFLCLAILLSFTINAQQIGSTQVPVKPETTVTPPEAQCSVTVSAPFDTGVFVFTISVTITGPCSEIREKGEALAWELLWKLFGYYKAYN